MYLFLFSFFLLCRLFFLRSIPGGKKRSFKRVHGVHSQEAWVDTLKLTHKPSRLPEQLTCARGSPARGLRVSDIFGPVKRVYRYRYIIVSFTNHCFTYHAGRNRTDILICTLLLEAQPEVLLQLIALTSALSLGGCVWSESHRNYVRFKSTLTHVLR